MNFFSYEKKNTKPFFSIITVVKNDEKNISQTILSITNQNYNNFEYIVIDGNSTDKTIKNILKFKKKINYFKSEKDKGIYYAMNKAINIAKGDIVIFVNSGDKLTKNALKIVSEYFLKDKHLDFVFGTVKRHYTKSTIIKSGYNKFRLNYNFDFATSHSTGFFIKLKSFKKVGKFNTDYRCSADYDFYLRALYKFNLKGAATSRNELIGIMKSGGYSSQISFLDHLFEETRIRFNNNQNIFLILLIFLNAIFKNTLKKIF